MTKALLYVAQQAPEETIHSIQESLEKRYGQPLSFSVSVKPELLGGYLAIVGDEVFDASLVSRAEKLRRHLLEEGVSALPGESVCQVLKKRLDVFEAGESRFVYGTVMRVGDGVARIAHLPGRCYGELLEFGEGIFGMALDLEEDGVGAVILNREDAVSEGMTVRGTGRSIDVPVGDCLLGRVIDPIGKPLDGIALHAAEFRAVEQSAPAIHDRRPVDTPLETGILAIDSMIPIGRGQRELIIGDRQTGKTTVALDTILNQRGKNVLCVYCAIGQKASNIRQTVEKLRASDALEYTVVVAATASDSAAMQYLAPYAACAVAEHFTLQGKDTLVVYDDLSKHAVAYRTMSLLLHRPPGREAYPGDVFYLHSRLLERSACLSHEKGGGSMTALPIIETMAGNISAYIPTNVISITDGQIYLETELFHNGIRPAVNTGLSVSRVGRAAQHKAMRKVSGRLRIELAQYREMAVFARFGSDLDDSTRKLLANGEFLTNLFKQYKGVNYSIAKETILLFAFQNGVFEDIPAACAVDATGSVLKHILDTCPEVARDINTSGDLTDKDAETLKKALEEWHYAKPE